MASTYTTQFKTKLGASDEVIDVLVEYGADFDGDGFNDIKVTLGVASGSNSGTEDIIGVGFDINDSLINQSSIVSGLRINDVTTIAQNGTTILNKIDEGTSTNADSFGVFRNANNIDGNDPGFPLGGAEPFDIGIRFSDGSQPRIKTASFVISQANTNLDKSLIENTDWYVRLQSTDGGAQSAKTAGTIGIIGGTPTPLIDVEKYVSVDGGINWEDADSVTGPSLLTGNNPQFKFVVTNIGNVALSNVSLSDSDFNLNGVTGDLNTGNSQYDIGALAAGGSKEVIFTGATWQLGQHTNTATTNGSYNGTNISDTDDANYFGANPNIDVEKLVSVDGGTTWVDADTATGPSLLTGNNPQFKFVVTNTGNVALSNATLSDSDFNLDGLTGDLTSGNSQYDIGALTAGGSKEVIFTGATWQAGQHTNTATTNGTYTDNGGHTTTKTDTDDANYFGANPSLDVEKLVSVDGGTTWQDADSATGPSLLTGNNPQFKFVVTNTGNVALSNVSLSDSDFNLNGLTGDLNTGNSQYDIGALTAGGSKEVIFTGATWQAGQHTNTATTNGTFTDGGGRTTTKTDTDDANYFGANPSIDVEKYVSVDGGTTWQDADSATGPSLLTGNNPQFKFVVTNTGNVALSNVSLSDSDFNLNGLTGDSSSGNSQYDIGTLAANASKEVIFTGATWQAGQHTNTATTNGTFTDGGGRTTSKTDTDDANYFGANPSIDVEKYVSGDGGKTWQDADSATGPSILTGNNPQFKFVVSNTGNVALSNVSLSDDKFNLNGLTGDLNTGNSQYDIGTLAANASKEVIFTGATWQAGQHTNTATTNGTFTDGGNRTTTKTDSDAANYFGFNPSINIDKVTSNSSVQGDGLLIQEASAIEWIYTVTNTGNVGLSNVSVTDNKGVTPVGVDANNDSFIDGDINKDKILDTTETWTYKASGTAILGGYQNTGTATGSVTDGFGNTKSVNDSDDSSYTGVKPAGARTPGFWKNWAAVWDGNASNDSTFKGREGFPGSDILLAPYSTFKDTDNDGKVDTALDPVTGKQELGILVGDWNRNGVTDGTEKTLFYSLNEAMTIISADQKTQQDKRYTLDRSLVASWLNYHAVNPAPQGDMNQAIQWIQQYTTDENGDGKGDGNLTLGTSVPASSQAWANPSDVFNGLPTGEILNAKLDYYNNTGSFGVQPV